MSTTFECLRAQAQLVRSGAAASEADRIRLEVHFERCPACASDARFLAAMEAATRAVRATGRGEQALQEALAETRRRRLSMPPPRRSVWPWAVAAAASALLAVGLFAGERAEEAGGAAPSEPHGRLEAEGPTRLIIGHAAVEATSGTVLSWSGARVSLEHGHIDVAVDPGPRRRFRVETQAFAVEVTGTRFAVDPDGVRVQEGSVRVEALDGAVLAAHVGAGETWARADGGPSRAAHPTAAATAGLATLGTAPEAEAGFGIEVPAAALPETVLPEAVLPRQCPPRPRPHAAPGTSAARAPHEDPPGRGASGPAADIAFNGSVPGDPGDLYATAPIDPVEGAASIVAPSEPPTANVVVATTAPMNPTDGPAPTGAPAEPPTADVAPATTAPMNPADGPAPIGAPAEPPTADEAPATRDVPVPVEEPRRPTARERFERAVSLEHVDAAAALVLYQGIERDGGSWAANALYARARLLVEQGRRTEGVRLLRRYLERYPTGANAADARELLAR